MFGLRTFGLITLAAVFVKAQISDQDAATMKACLRTITQSANFETQPSYSPTDDTHYVNSTWTYDPVLCTAISVPVNRIYVENSNTGDRYQCTRPATLDSSGMAYGQCPITLGFQARAAEAGDDLCELRSQKREYSVDSRDAEFRGRKDTRHGDPRGLSNHSTIFGAG
jgi:hypothetical protein